MRHEIGRDVYDRYVKQVTSDVYYASVLTLTLDKMSMLAQNRVVFN